MTISFRCAACNRILRTVDKAAGKRATCRCGATVLIPSAKVSSPPAVETGEPTDDEIVRMLLGPAADRKPAKPAQWKQPQPSIDESWSASERIRSRPVPQSPPSHSVQQPVAPTAIRRRWPWVAGPAAIVTVVVGAGLFLAGGWWPRVAPGGVHGKPLDAATGKPLGKEILPSVPRTLWGIEDAVVTTTWQSLDISHSFSDSGMNMRLTPKEGKRFAIVRFKLTALTPDPKVAEALLKRREPAEVAKLGPTATPPTPLPANAQFRLFGMHSAAVVFPGGERGAFFWPVDPKGVYIGHYVIFHHGGLTLGGGEPIPPWYDSHLSNDSFHGYLEINRPVEVVFVASIPQMAKLADLRLQLESDPPVSLRIGL